MKLVHPKEMSPGEQDVYRICLASAGVEVAREELLTSLAKGLGQLEDGLKVLDRQFPVPRSGACDILACDAFSNAVMMNVCQILDIYGVAAALGRAKWLVENWDTVAHFHPSLKTKNVRIVIVAGRVDDGALPIVSRMREIEIFSYHGLNLSEEAWVVLQKFEHESVPVETRVVEEPRQEEEKDYNSILTEEEIGEFFDKPAESFDGEDEVTNRLEIQTI